MKKKLNAAIITITILLASLLSVFNSQCKEIFYGDALGYYIYLPAAFIHHNLKEPLVVADESKLSKPRKRIRDFLENHAKSPTGNYLNQYTYGVALMEAPFFFAAHAFEKVTGKSANGFSNSYKNMIRAATLFYALLGLYILFLCLKRSFFVINSLVGISILAIGTNFLWFTIVQAGMAHIILFFLVASLLYLTIRIYEFARVRYFVLLGFVLGLIALIRPTDLIFIFIPLLYKVYSLDTLLYKFKFLYAQRWKIVIAMLIFGLLMIPQMLYWKSLTGHYIYYSYGQQGFDWKHPHMYEGLFSYKNGWLVYTPVMGLGLLGMYFIKRLRDVYLTILIILPVYIYIIYAWYCYSYINGLGSRPMVHIYPLLAFPLVALIQFFAHQKMIYKALFGALVLFLSAISYSYCIQQAKGNLWSENSTKIFNIHTLFRYHLSYNDLVCFDNEIIQPEKQKVHFVSNLDNENFENFYSQNLLFDTVKKSKVYLLHQGAEYPERLLQSTYNSATYKGAKWIKCSGNFNAPNYCELYKNHLIVLEIKRGEELLLWKSCVINNKIGLANGTPPKKGFNLFDVRTKLWGEVFFYVPLPPNLKDGDTIKMIIWGIDKRELLIDDLKMELFR